MCPTFFHAYQTSVFLHNTINGTLRYTNFPSNLSLSTMSLRQIFLAQNKCFYFFNFVSSSSGARTASAGKTFRSSSTINLANNLIQSTTRLAFYEDLKSFCSVKPVFELPEVWGVEPPYLTLPTPYLWSKFNPGGSSFNPPPKFC